MKLCFLLLNILTLRFLLSMTFVLCTLQAQESDSEYVELTDEPSRSDLFAHVKEAFAAAHPELMTPTPEGPWTKSLFTKGAFIFPQDAKYDRSLPCKPARQNSIFGIDVSHHDWPFKGFQ